MNSTATFSVDAFRAQAREFHPIEQAAKRQPSVHEALEHIEKGVAVVCERFAELRHRLGPVVRSNPQPAQPQKTCGIGGCEVSGKLSSQVDRLAELDEAIREVLASLEI